MKHDLKKLSFLFLLSCALSVGIPVAQAQAPAASVTHGIVVADMDRSVRPGDDFYEFANGHWLRTTEIPSDLSSVSVFSQLTQLSNVRTAALIQDVAKSDKAESADAQKIADLYRSYMDEAKIESTSLGPLKPELDRINAIRDKHELARVLGEDLRADVDPLNDTNYHTPNLFGVWVAPGFSDPAHYALYMLQGGLEMPDREYYVQDNEHMRDIQTKYRAHVIAMLKLAGISDSDKRADRVLGLEHDIAEQHWSLADDQDVHKADNPWKMSDFASKAPGLDWKEFFRAASLNSVKTIIVWQPSAITGEAALVSTVPLETWKDWLTFHAIEDHAEELPRAFRDEQFAFSDGVLSGIEQQEPRWQRAVDMVNNLLGDAVGKLYAQRYFPPESKARAQKMVTNIIAAFNTRIDALTWMDPSTEAEAHKKLNALYVGIGYPEVWKDYSGLEIKPDDLYGNKWRSAMFQYRQELSRLGKPVERREWCMTPQTVNAVNLPLQDALNFPAAILEPPFFDSQAPDAFNYGAIGSIIGHEVSHTFDSEGSAFDSTGALRNWWKPSDLQHFNAATEKLVEQYDHYHPFSDLTLNGRQTLGENIADLGGLEASYDAYHASLQGKTAPEQDGFSGDQQYFIAYAQSHRSRIRAAALRKKVMTNAHSPWQYRTYTVRNVDAWYQTFHVKPGEKLYLTPTERVQIW
jgi:putative endopeptidase